MYRIHRMRTGTWGSGSGSNWQRTNTQRHETFPDANRVQNTRNANRNLGFRVGVKLAEDKYTKARNIPGCKPCTEYTECGQEAGVPGRGQTGRGQIHTQRHTHIHTETATAAAGVRTVWHTATIIMRTTLTQTTQQL